MAYQQILRSVVLAPHHKTTGFTRHYRGNEILPRPHELQIARYPDREGYYLLHLDRQGIWQTDTLHDSLESALKQAQLEFSVSTDDWDIYTPPKRKAYSTALSKERKAAQRLREQLRPQASPPHR